jgi:hypothetical protein
MNPEPTTIDSDEDFHAYANETFSRVLAGMHIIEDAVSGRTLSSEHRRQLERHIERLRAPAERVYEDMRLKLATASEPTTYGSRLKAWVVSPWSQMFNWPFIAVALTQAAQGKVGGLVAFVGAAALLTFVPPLIDGPPPTLQRERASIAFIVAATVVVVALLLLFGLLAAIVGLVICIAAFLLGQSFASPSS